MFATKKTKYNMVLYIGAFVICMFWRVCFYFSIWGEDAIVISTGVLILVWIQTLSQRIIDRHVRRLLISIAMLFLLYNYIQAVKYNFTWDIGRRYCWYAFYIPMIMVPMLCLFLAILAGKEERYHTGPWMYLWIPCILFIVGIMTNDIHQWAFIFQPDFYSWDAEYRYGVLYFVVVAWIVILLFSTIIIIFMKSNTPQCRRYIWLPLVPLVIGAAYCWFYATKEELISINGIQLIPLPQAFEFMIIGFLEGCIQAGLLQSNDGYKNIFEKSAISACIRNEKGELIFHSGIQPNQEIGRELRIHTHSIPGGMVEWAEDITMLCEYKHKLEDIQEELSGEEILLREEGQINKERAEIEVHNRIYNQILEIIQKQRKQIQRLLEEEVEEETVFAQNLSKACVLNAYIKRRSNLTILMNSKERMPVRELDLSIQESLENIQMLGIKSGCFCDSELYWRGEELVALYDYFEAVIENGISTIKAIFVNLFVTEEKLEFRLMVENPGELPELRWKSSQIMIQSEEESVSIRICFFREGDRLWV